jgi:vacuolar-type H+-ATPase subunit H
MGQSGNPVNRLGQSGADDDISDVAVTPETEHLRRDIEHTRSDMSGTLDAIQQKLNPETIGEQAKDTASEITTQAKEAALEVFDHALAEVKTQASEVLEQAREVLVEARVTAREVLGEARSTAREAVEDATTQAKAAVRGATIGKVETMIRSANDTTNAARYGLMETIKANPFPAALTGLGLGWLFINSRSAAARGSTARPAYEARYRENTSSTYRTGSSGGGMAGGIGDRAQETVGNVAGQAGDLAGRAGGAIGDAVGQVGETAGDIASRVGETTGSIAGQVGETASNLVSQVGETAGNIASGTKETAGNIAEQAQYQAMRLEDNFQRVLRESPLAVGAVTLALGAAVGLALPQTSRENQLLGEARDTFVERAQDLAQETIGKVQNVATEAQSAVKDTVKEEAKKQGLTQ